MRVEPKQEHVEIMEIVYKGERLFIMILKNDLAIFTNVRVDQQDNKVKWDCVVREVWWVPKDLSDNQEEEQVFLVIVVLLGVFPGRSVRPRCSWYRLLIFSELPMLGVEAAATRLVVALRGGLEVKREAELGRDVRWSTRVLKGILEKSTDKVSDLRINFEFRNVKNNYLKYCQVENHQNR